MGDQSTPRAKASPALPFTSADLRKLLVGRDDPRPPTRHPRWSLVVNWAVAVATALAYLVSHAELDHRHVGSELVIDAVLALPVALIRRYPLWAFRIAWLTALLLPLVVSTESSTLPWVATQFVVFPFVLYTVASRYRRGVVIWTGALMAALLALYVPVVGILSLAIPVAVALVLGDHVRRRREAQHELAVEEERTELEQARRAVLEERTRIAREMHDVVAHHMSMIAVRAESAGYRIEGLPDAASSEFAGIADAARQALGEMRRLLGVLRSESPDLERTPQPGLDDLDDLIGTARDSGVAVSLTRIAVPAEVPDAVGLSAYRIVQEGLSNATRHAQGAAVTVEVAGTDRLLVIDVTNGPGGVPSITSGSVRHGLVGMRERVAMLGGRFEAGPKPGGGFALRAELPLDGVSMS